MFPIADDDIWWKILKFDQLNFLHLMENMLCHYFNRIRNQNQNFSCTNKNATLVPYSHLYNHNRPFLEQINIY